MFELLVATRFMRVMTAGKTKPVLLTCERPSGEMVEVVAKLSAGGCNVQGIAREALVSMLAADLGVAVPEPVLVDIDDEFIAAIPAEHSAVAQAMRASVLPTFGSALLPHGFSIWTADRHMTQELCEPGAEIFAFDALTLNPDRRVKNPNLQSNGHSFAIYDHELALMTETVGTFFQPHPWQINSLSFLSQGEGEHVLYRGLRGRGAQIGRLEATWGAIAPERFAEYMNAIPPEWQDAEKAMTDAVEYLCQLRPNLAAAFAEVRRVLA